VLNYARIEGPLSGANRITAFSFDGPPRVFRLQAANLDSPAGGNRNAWRIFGVYLTARATSSLP
jgi:hypothetical protein